MTGPGPSELFVRAAALYMPITLALACAVHARPDRRRLAGALLATAWNLAAVLAVNAVAVATGWWAFATASAAVAGVPADLWVGWAVLWGAVPILATTTRRGLAVAGAGLVAADLVLMPLARPVVLLHGPWLAGEGAAVAASLVPGLLLGRWTAEGRRLARRATLQLVAFTGLVGYVVPSLVFAVTGEGWGTLIRRPRWHLVLAGVVVSPFVAMAVQAVSEFAAAGGTPFPLDPPPTLVTTGPYAYVANPMQLAGTVLLAAWGVLLGSPAVVAAAGAAGAFSAGLAAWSEGAELGSRFGDGWRTYRRRVRLWLPRWRPAVLHPAVVHVAATCPTCSQVGRFLSARRPVALEVSAAEGCPLPLERITYQRGAQRAAGVSAVGRSLEHVSLGWAALAWIGRLPLLEQLLQLVADAVVGRPGSTVPAAAGADAMRGAPTWPAS